MSRGFGATLGAGTTDKITTTLTTDAVLRSWFAWTYNNGHGGGNLGRIFDRQSGVNVEVLFDNQNNTANTYAFNRSWTTGGSWRFPAPAQSVWSAIGVSYDGGSTSNNPIVYVDGAKPTVTTLVAPTGARADLSGAATIIGNRDSDNARNWDGSLAEFAVWNAILSDDEFFALCKGFSPLLIRRNALVEYVPLVRDNVSRLLAAPTISGTAVRPHPRVLYPATSRP